MQRRGTVAVVATLAFATANAGCGSGTLNNVELARQVNAICKQRTVRVAALRKQHVGDIHGMIAAVVPVDSRTVADLGALKPSDNAQASYSRYVAIQRTYLAQIRQVAAGKRLHDSPQSEHARVHEMWRLTSRLGLRACNE